MPSEAGAVLESAWCRAAGWSPVAVSGSLGPSSVGVVVSASGEADSGSPPQIGGSESSDNAAEGPGSWAAMCVSSVISGLEDDPVP